MFPLTFISLKIALQSREPCILLAAISFIYLFSLPLKSFLYSVVPNGKDPLTSSSVLAIYNSTVPQNKSQTWIVFQVGLFLFFYSSDGSSSRIPQSPHLDCSQAREPEAEDPAKTHLDSNVQKLRDTER